MNINTINNIIQMNHNSLFDSNYSIFNINKIFTEKKISSELKNIIFLSNCISGDHLFEFLVNNSTCEIYAFDENFSNYALTCLKIATIIVCDESSFLEIIFYGNSTLFDKKYKEIKYVMTNLFADHGRELVDFWDTHRRHIQNLHRNSKMGVFSNIIQLYCKANISWKMLMNDVEKNGKFDKEFIELNKIKLFNEISNKWITYKEFNNFVELIKNDDFQSTLYYFLFGRFFKVPYFYEKSNYMMLKKNINKIHVSTTIDYKIQNLLYNNKIDYCLLKNTGDFPFYLIKNAYFYEYSLYPNNGIVYIYSNYKYKNENKNKTIEWFQMYCSYHMFQYKKYFDFLSSCNFKLDKVIIHNYLLESNRFINNFLKNETFENKKILIISWNDFDSFHPIIFKNFMFENILVLSNESLQYKNYYKKTIFEINESNLFDYVICNFGLNLKKYRYKVEKFINKIIDVLKTKGKMMITDLTYNENSYWDSIFSDFEMCGNFMCPKNYFEQKTNLSLLDYSEANINIFNTNDKLQEIIQTYIHVFKK